MQELIIPLHIAQNLNAQFPLRPYQAKAIQKLIYFLNSDSAEPKHGLFHMATGSGKTLIMAAAILELYQRGFRRFVFVVSSTSIVEKTKMNFLHSQATKYLFNKSGLEIGGISLKVKEVHAFHPRKGSDAEILFSTVQGLHSLKMLPKENMLTFDQLTKMPLVVLSDEAHHINVSTKATKMVEGPTWESTVMDLFRLNRKNVMLEFTATAELSHDAIAKKYTDKIIFDYPLKSFRQDGYSKNVRVLQLDVSVIDRAFSACLLQIYREVMFSQHDIDCKPVLLLKSRTISESNRAYYDFFENIDRLTIKKWTHIAALLSAQISLEAMFSSMPMEEWIDKVRKRFTPQNTLVVNSKDESEGQQLLLNTLEDKDNKYRLIFAVDKLNEGWDVLNLFDIVKLYTTSSKSIRDNQISTLSEAQLIGRGARYFPFRWKGAQPTFQRKFDQETDHPLNICETLYYHTDESISYIDALHQTLKDVGLIAPKGEQTQIPTIDTSGVRYTSLPIFARFVELESGNQDTPLFNCLDIWSEPMLRQAMDQLIFYRFDSLKRLFPELNSRYEWIHDHKFLATVQIAGLTQDITNDKVKLYKACLHFLLLLADRLSKGQ